MIRDPLCDRGRRVTWISGLAEPIGGEGGIRTHGRLAPTPVFKTGALNHSATSPDNQFNNLALAVCQPFVELAPDWHRIAGNLRFSVLISSLCTWRTFSAFRTCSSK